MVEEIFWEYKRQNSEHNAVLFLYIFLINCGFLFLCSLQDIYFTLCIISITRCILIRHPSCIMLWKSCKNYWGYTSLNEWGQPYATRIKKKKKRSIKESCLNSWVYWKQWLSGENKSLIYASAFLIFFIHSFFGICYISLF
jgi:hypothetical protein